MLLSLVLHYRLDVLLLAALTVTAGLGCRRVLHRHRSVVVREPVVAMVLVGLLAVGGLAAERAGDPEKRGFILGGAALLILVGLAGMTAVTLWRAEHRERRTALQEVQKQKDAADRASQAKGELIALMSHEIRSPLTALTGYASLLTETPLDPVQERYVHTLGTMADRLNRVVSDLLDLIRLQEGRLTLEVRPFSPAGLAQEVIDAMTAPARAKGLELQPHIETPAELTLLGDALRLRQVLVGLMAHAIAFTDRGRVTLEASWQPSPGELVLRVNDTGRNIAPEQLALLLGSQSEAAVQPTPRTGPELGLALCQQLVTLMHGRIEAQSLPGQGSAFVVAIPCVRPPGAVPAG